MNTASSSICGKLRPICGGCAEVAESLGIKLTTPHRSCRRVTIENVAAAARMLDVPLMEMFAEP